MLPLLYLLVAFIGWLLTRPLTTSPRAAVATIGAALRELCLAVMVTGAIFSVCELWLLRTTDLGSSTATVAQFEQALHTLRSWIGIIRPTPWLQFVCLGSLFLLAAAKVLGAGMLRRTSAFLAIVGRAYTAATVLVCLTFFGGVVSGGLAARTAHLSEQIDAVGRGYESVAGDVPSGAPQVVIRHLIEQAGYAPLFDDIATVNEAVRTQAAEAQRWRQDFSNIKEHPRSFQETRDLSARTSAVLDGFRGQPSSRPAPIAAEGFTPQTLSDAHALLAAVNTESSSATRTLSPDGQALLWALVGATYCSTVKPEVHAAIAAHVSGAAGELIGIFADPLLHEPLKRVIATVGTSFLSDFVASHKASETWSAELSTYLNRELEPLAQVLRSRSPQVVAAIAADRSSTVDLDRRAHEDAAVLAHRHLSEDWRRLTAKAEALNLDPSVRGPLLHLLRRTEASLGGEDDVLSAFPESARTTKLISDVIDGTSSAATLVQFESKQFGTTDFASSFRAARLEQEAIGSRWGRMRHRLARVVSEGQMQVEPKQLALMRAAVSRWEQYRDAVVVDVALTGAAADGQWDRAFLDYTKSAPDMAALWGYAVITFSDESEFTPFIADRIPDEIARLERRVGSLSTKDKLEARRMLLEHGPKPVDGYRYYVESVGSWNDQDASRFFASDAVGDRVNAFCPVK